LPTGNPKPAASPAKGDTPTPTNPEEDNVKPTTINGIDPRRIKALRNHRPTYEADILVKRFIGAPITDFGSMTNFESSNRTGTVFLGKTAEGYWPTLEFTPSQFDPITKMQVGDEISAKCAFRGIGTITIFSKSARW
jgi:hypothetical protein